MKKRGKGAKPRIPAFKQSLRNKTPEAYRDRLKVLKKRYGVEFSFASNAKLTPQRKSAITRKVRKLTEFLNPENRFVFVKTTKKQLRGIKRNSEISRQQRTSKGVFLPKPKNAGKKRTRFRISDTGEIATRTGNFTSHFRLFPSAEVAADPSIIEKEGRAIGAEAVFVSIKGHRGGSRKNGYSLKSFMRYLREQIIPDIEDAEEDESSKTAFRNWFGVEFVTYEWRKTKAKRKAR